MRQRALHIILAFALVLFSWTELAHANDLQAHLDEQGCEVCLFVAHLGHGAASSTVQLPVLAVRHSAPQHPVPEPAAETVRHTLGQRGPPLHS